jgi:curved DNA-binding protein CbpA
LLLFEEVKKSHYEILGVAKTAPAAEIKRAYFTLVRKYQPDRSPEEFKEIRAAYETLADEKKRSEYDAVGNLPPSVAPFFYEAQRFERFGRLNKAAELYRLILKSRPELDNIREHYARSLAEDDKTGKAGEVWEELCQRHPENPRYARELGRCYLDRGWHKKALTEIRRSLDLDRASIDSWSLLMTCTAMRDQGKPNWNEFYALSLEALKAVKEVTADEWKKIQFHSYAFVTGGAQNPRRVRVHLQEIIRLIREGGREGQDEGRNALKELLHLVPCEFLTDFYGEFKEMADLLSGMNDRYVRGQLEIMGLNFLIEGLVKKKFPEIFRDLLRLINAEMEDEEDELDIAAAECMILEEKDRYDPQIRRLKTEFPELYALHGSFFNEALRTKDPEKLLYQRIKKYKKLKRKTGIPDEEDEDSALPEPVRRSQPKVGRNDPCPCGSGKKYKRCCGA